jgi:hypothetical protein
VRGDVPDLRGKLPQDGGVIAQGDFEWRAKPFPMWRRQRPERGITLIDLADEAKSSSFKS